MKRSEKQNTPVGEAHRPETAVLEHSPQDQLTTFARDILRLCGEARRLTSDAIDHDHEAGKVCLHAKAACKDAGVPWEPWCEEHLKAIGGLRSVQRLMQVAKNWKRIEAERKKTPDLTTKAALRLLANARRKQPERTREEKSESEDQRAERVADHTPRLEVSRSRAVKVAEAMGLDPRVAIEYLRLMVAPAGLLVAVTDD